MVTPSTFASKDHWQIPSCSLFLGARARHEVELRRLVNIANTALATSSRKEVVYDIGCFGSDRPQIVFSKVSLCCIVLGKEVCRFHFHPHEYSTFPY